MTRREIEAQIAVLLEMRSDCETVFPGDLAHVTLPHIEDTIAVKRQSLAALPPEPDKDARIAQLEAFILDLIADMPPKIDSRMKYREVQFSDADIEQMRELMSSDGSDYLARIKREAAAEELELLDEVWDVGESGPTREEIRDRATELRKGEK